MDQHRICKAVKTTFIDITKNFSSFKFIEDYFLSEFPALHRCFSLGRSFEAQTLGSTQKQNHIFYCPAPSALGMMV